jgi:hypothetical protein
MKKRPVQRSPYISFKKRWALVGALLPTTCAKQQGREGSLGVGAGRGSSAIDGAVSRFLTLSPIYKMENGVMTAQESDTRRQLVSTKRGGATEHLIVDSRDWSLQGSAEALKTEERRERAKGGLNDDQQACFDVLVEAPDKCHTTREGG